MQGFLKLATDRGERTFALGPSTDLEAEPPVLDWRTAPLAEVFFRHGPGEPYEIEAAGRMQEGTVLARGLVDRGATLVETSPAPVPTSAALLNQIDRTAMVTLDAEQQRAVDLPEDVSLVVDGEAGVGKTLVALYRVASLARRARERGRTLRSLILVPTEGLRRLVRLLVDRLGITRVEIATIDAWLVERAQAAFKLPARTSESPAAQVIAIKRHPAVRTVLDDFIGWKLPRGAERDERFGRARTRLFHLWGDRDRMRRVLDAAGGELPERAIEAVALHTRAQFERTTEELNKHVDADRLVALDGLALDAGTPAEDAGTFDAEDAPVLFELARRGALRAQVGELVRYDHIVIDEAQLRAPMELAAIADALAPAGTVTLAGDHRQATDETAWFASWAAARDELRRGVWFETTLAVSYRSVPAIAAFARGITDGTARIPGEPPPDPAVWATPCEHALAQAARTCWHLDALLARDPWRQIAIIARNPEHARRLHGELRGLDATLVLDGDFRFDPGVVVTTAAAVAGLEFDAVVIPDLAEGFYPKTPELARSLYVASTRARDWLWLLAAGPWSPLVCENSRDG